MKKLKDLRLLVIFLSLISCDTGEEPDVQAPKPKFIVSDIEFDNWPYDVDIGTIRYPELWLEINDGGLEISAYIKYDSVLIIEQYGFEYRVEGADDSLKIKIDFLDEKDTIDFTQLEDNTLVYSAEFPLDGGIQYQICQTLLVDCFDIPWIGSSSCNEGKYEPNNCVEITAVNN